MLLLSFLLLFFFFPCIYNVKSIFISQQDQATGRGFVVRHIKFSENYRIYSRSHFVKGCGSLSLSLSLSLSACARAHACAKERIALSHCKMLCKENLGTKLIL
jgi:hypothetical protein